MTTVSEICVNAIRGIIVAEPGSKLVVADLSNIEGRVAAWIAGEEWKLQAFRDYDRGVGHDLYLIGAGRILGKRPEDVTKLERQNEGKVPELACLGPDTLVVTSRGTKKIVSVSRDDLLWDGVEWVAHEGLIGRGLKTVLRLSNVEMTPDHLVLCRETWVRAEQVASSPSFLGQALETGSANLPSLASNSAPKAASATSSSNVVAEHLRTDRTLALCGEAKQQSANLALRSDTGTGQKIGSGTPMCAPTPTIDGGSATAYRLATTDVTMPKTLDTTTMAVEAYTSTSHGGQIAELSSRTSSVYQDGTSPNLNSTARTSTEATNRATSALSLGDKTKETDAKLAISSNELLNLRHVYDIVNAGPRKRFTIISDDGPIIVHNCQFGGAVGAFAKMSANFGIVMAEERIVELVKAWRRSHPAIVSMWYALEDAAKNAIRFPNDMFEVRGLRFDAQDHWLRIRMPSGSYLSYPNARVGSACPKCEGKGKTLESGVVSSQARIIACPDCEGSGKADTQIWYDGVDQYTKKWGPISTYSGKIFENLVQKIARDVFMRGFRAAARAGYSVIARVHDELITEVPDDPRYTAEGLSAIMATNPPWAVGLPLAAAGHSMFRYSKQD